MESLDLSAPQEIQGWPTVGDRFKEWLLQNVRRATEQMQQGQRTMLDQVTSKGLDPMEILRNQTYGTIRATRADPLEMIGGMGPAPIMAATNPSLVRLIGKFKDMVQEPAMDPKLGAVSKKATNLVTDYMESIKHDPEVYDTVRGFYRMPNRPGAYGGEWNPHSMDPVSRGKIDDLLRNYSTGKLSPVGEYRDIPGATAAIGINEASIHPSIFEDKERLLNTMLHEMGHHRQGFSPTTFPSYEYVKRYPEPLVGRFGHSNRADEAVADINMWLEHGLPEVPKTAVRNWILERNKNQIPFGDLITRYERDPNWSEWLGKARTPEWFIYKDDPDLTYRMLAQLLGAKERGYQVANLLAKRATGMPLTNDPAIAAAMKKIQGNVPLEVDLYDSKSSAAAQGILEFMKRAGMNAPTGGW